MTQRRPTQSDVARLAGVSVSTVSKALNGVGEMKSETRQRVVEAADRLGFTLLNRARAEVRERSYTVGLITTDHFGRFTGPVMLGVEDALGAGRISVLLADGRGDRIRESHYVETFLARRVDGIIVTGRRAESRLPLTNRDKVPTVYVLSRSDDPADVSVVIDDEQGGTLSVEHLLSVGRRRIACVTGPKDHLAARLRTKGARAALGATGLTEAVPTLWGPWSEEWGRRAAALALLADSEIDGFVCGSDQIARGLVDGLRAHGVSVPSKVSVVGFDNWDVMAEASSPPLTTVDPQLERLGRFAAKTLLQMIAGEEHPAGVLPQPCRLEIGGSSIPMTP